MFWSHGYFFMQDYYSYFQILTNVPTQLSLHVAKMQIVSTLMVHTVADVALGLQEMENIAMVHHII